MNPRSTRRSTAVRRDASRVQLLILVVMLIAVSVRSSFAQQETLDSKKDVARRNGGIAADKIIVEPPSMSLSELVSQSDLIIRGRLGTVTARLSDDESTVFRDFAVTPIVIIKQRPGLAQASKPGPLPGLTLRQIGGRVTVEGLTLVGHTRFWTIRSDTLHNGTLVDRSHCRRRGRVHRSNPRLGWIIEAVTGKGCAPSHHRTRTACSGTGAILAPASSRAFQLSKIPRIAWRMIDLPCHRAGLLSEHGAHPENIRRPWSCPPYTVRRRTR